MTIYFDKLHILEPSKQTITNSSCLELKTLRNKWIFLPQATSEDTDTNVSATNVSVFIERSAVSCECFFIYFLFFT